MTTRIKSFLYYVGGIITGIVLSFAFLFVFANKTSNDGLVMYDSPQQEIDANYFNVFQVFTDGSAALATVQFPLGNYGMVVLFPKQQGFPSFYDDQNIKIPENKKVMQVGTYTYKTRDELQKTVPVVRIYDK